jgi:sugar (pentulose or hexulose) kinase
MPLVQFLGIDFGTSGCRACLIDTGCHILGEAQLPLPALRYDESGIEQDPALWWDALKALLNALRQNTPLDQVRALALDGTSASLLLCDADGRPIGPACMYNDARATAEAEQIRAVAPPETGAQGASSSLAKLLRLRNHTDTTGVSHALHQADWLANRLTGRFGFSDENNALKLGYDPVSRTWPTWLAALGVPGDWLPQVLEPGTPLGPLVPALADELGLPRDTQVRVGTTDSTAGVLSTGPCAVGDAVTSLGSTLVLKIISDGPVFAPHFGVYSHRLGERWLVGGASNSGGAVLRRHFSQAALDRLTPALRPDAPTGLDYYPLPAPGERFPINDPSMPPRIEPRPADDVLFFQAILEGMARIEAAGYRRLVELGAPAPKRVLSIGGGTRNPAWRQLREQYLGVAVTNAEHQQAAYGTARLAALGLAAIGI